MKILLWIIKLNLVACSAFWFVVGIHEKEPGNAFLCFLCSFVVMSNTWRRWP